MIVDLSGVIEDAEENRRLVEVADAVVDALDDMDACEMEGLEAIAAVAASLIADACPTRELAGMVLGDFVKRVGEGMIALEDSGTALWNKHATN